MDAARALPGRRQVRLDGDVKLGGRTALAHLVDMDARAGAVVGAVFADRAHVHDLRAGPRRSASRSGTLIVIGPRPRI